MNHLKFKVMKLNKIIFSGLVSVFALAMAVSCGSNNTASEETATKCCDSEKCTCVEGCTPENCTCECGVCTNCKAKAEEAVKCECKDSVCAAANCANCVEGCEGCAPNCKEACAKKCCKDGDKPCCKEGEKGDKPCCKEGEKAAK